MERATQRLIVDASVIAKWFLPEEDSDKALSIRDAFTQGSIDLIAPDLIAYELSNALHRYPAAERRVIQRDIKDFFALDIDLIGPSPELLSSSLSLGRSLGVTIYDASYLALASEIGANFVTADEYLLRKARPLSACLFLAEMGTKWALPP